MMSINVVYHMIDTVYIYARKSQRNYCVFTIGTITMIGGGHVTV